MSTAVAISGTTSSGSSSTHAISVSSQCIACLHICTPCYCSVTGSPVPLAPPAGPIDFDKKILHMSWHPRDDIIAVAGLNKLYIYTAQQRC
jgi:hypothetical protein